MEHKVNMAFAKNLIHLLEKNKMRNIDLSQKIGLTKQAITNYTRGKVPLRDNLMRIASYFDVTVEYLLKDHDEYNLKTSLEENETFSLSIDFFNKTLSSTDVIYKRDNFQSNFSSPIPVYKDAECYAVMAYDNLMKGYGIDKGSIAVFASNEPVLEGDIAAVLIKSEKRIVIRTVSFTERNIILISDSTEEKFKKTSKDCDAVILGKIIRATFDPNKKKTE